jgi:hypothetical protein
MLWSSIFSSNGKALKEWEAACAEKFILEFGKAYTSLQDFRMAPRPIRRPPRPSRGKMSKRRWRCREGSKGRRKEHRGICEERLRFPLPAVHGAAVLRVKNTEHHIPV